MPSSCPDLLKALREDGFAILANVLDDRAVRFLIDAIEGRQTGHGMRNLLHVVPEVGHLARSRALQPLLAEVLGPAAIPVRGLFIDKTPAANWKVPWHQDLTIAVQRKIDVAGFGSWSMKGGVPHVQAPVSLLEQMLTIRLHLDDCDETNGPLKVIPGSHLAGRLSAEAIEEWRHRTRERMCLVPRGGALIMRPLLLHASSAARWPGHRRVIHLEYAAQSLPAGLSWREEDLVQRSEHREC